MSNQERHSSSIVVNIPAYVRLSRKLWKIVFGLGTSVLFPLALNLISTWFTNSKGIIPVDSPFGWLLARCPLVFLVGCCLLLLALLLWVVSQWPWTVTNSSSLALQKRAHMLGRLRHSYQQLSRQLLSEVAWIDLGLVQKPNAVQNAAIFLSRSTNQREQTLPSGTSILDVYDQAEHELLILGEPGIDKSTLLLKLAEQLVKRAEGDELHPLPVILSLSSWASTRLPLQDWLSQQVSQIYDIAKHTARDWVQAGQILPLLDGLDEMEETARPACIAAINAYHHQNLTVPLVVSSRQFEYEHAATKRRLNLQRAIEVQRLTHRQVDTYLLEEGKSLLALRNMLKRNSVLRDLTTIPLILNVLVLTYQGIKIRGLAKQQALLQNQVWSDYVQSMVEQKGIKNRYTLEQINVWLGWLAQQMSVRNQIDLFLEQLQPDWLSKKQQFLYQCSVVLVVALFVVLYNTLIWILIFGLRFWLIGVQIVPELLEALPLGLMGGVTLGLFLMKRAIQPSEVLNWSLKDLWLKIFLGLFIVLSGGAFVQISKRLTAIITGKQSVERFHLSPNEGIRRSARNGLFVGLLGGECIMLLIDPFISLSRIPAFWVLEKQYLAFFFGLLLALYFGLGAFIQHYILRFWLWRFDVFPWNAVRFLNDATTCILLQRVDGGYRFTHRLLLDHFLSLYTKSLSVPTTVNRIK